MKHISQEQNLPGVTVRQMFQDSKGIIWIGVESYGLCRYDGYDFELFGSSLEDSTTLCNTVVEALCEDSRGNIWAGTQYGLSIYRRGSHDFVSHYASEDSLAGLPGNTILSLCSSKGARCIWIGTSSGLARFSEADSSMAQIALGAVRPASVYKIVESADGTIWCASSAGLFQLTPQGSVLRHLHRANSPVPSDHIRSMCVLADSSILLGSEMALMRYVPRTGSLSTVPFVMRSTASTGDYITDIVQDQRSNIWVSTTTDGLSVLSPDLRSYVHHTPEAGDADGLKSKGVRDIMLDRAGMLWFGLKFEGIQQFSYQSQIFGTSSTVPMRAMRDKNIISITEVHTGDIWLGTGKGGIHVLDTVSGTVRHLAPPQFPELSNARINAVCQTADGAVWIATAEHLYRTDVSARVFVRLLAGNCIDLLADSSALWVGTTTGVTIIDGGRTYSLGKYCGLPGLDIRHSVKCLFRDSRANIWVGTLHSGLFRWDATHKKMHHFAREQTQPNGISGDHIRSLAEDRTGNIWITTRGQGLNCYSYRDSSFGHFTERNGLPSNTLFGILIDDDGYLWISSYQGLCRFDPLSGKSHNFTKEYGLQNDIFEPRATCRSSSGTFYFGGDNGYNSFRPEQIAPVQQASPLVITTVKVFDRQILADIDSSISIRLPYDENFISFEFSLLDFSSKLGKKYSYILKGFDTKWQTASNRHYASYTNIEPGKYTFLIRAESKDGTPNANTVSVDIQIYPPFWNTLWFRILFGVILSAAVYSIITYRLHRERRRSKLLESLVNRKTEHLDRQKQELIAQKQRVEDAAAALERNNVELVRANQTKNTLISVIAHDMKNQFSAILSFSGMLSSAVAANTRSVYAQYIESATRAANDTLENLLFWYKSQHSCLQPQTAPIGIFDLVHTVANNYSAAAMEKGIELRISVPQEMAASADKDMLTAIVRNLVNNAIKHTDAGYVAVSAELRADWVLVSVSDTGDGMSQETLETLFMPDRHAQGESVGSGLGLQICQRFCDAMSCELSVTSTIGQGSCFSIQLPYAGAQEQVCQQEFSPAEPVAQSADDAHESLCRLLRNKHILIIDDNAQLLQHLELILSRYARVASADNGSDGIALAESQVPDLIITDLMMPGINGIQLTERIRSNTRTRHIPVILLTGQNFDSVQESAFAAGVTDFIAKPFDPDRFIIKIKNILQLKEAIKYQAQLAPDQSEAAAPATFLDIVIETIKQQSDYSAFSVETLADRLCMSKSTLIRKLKAETDLSPYELLNDIRFEKSKALLSAGKHSVSEIAWMLGFNESKYFSKKFREKYGMSPREYTKGNG